MINEDELLFAQILLLIDRCGYLNDKTLNRIEKVFLAHVKWHVAVLCSEQELFDFVRQLKDYTRSPSEKDANHESATPDEVMSHFERTLQTFGRKFDEKSSEDLSESSDTINFDIDAQSASLTFAFKRMSVGEATLSSTASEEDKPLDHAGFDIKMNGI